MTGSVSRFVWYELMTTDIDAAETFYTDLLGWQVNAWDGPGPRYTLISNGGEMIGGIMERPEEVAAAGVPPMWMGYIGVEDVDAKAEEIVAAGGSVKRAPQDIPDVGRFAVVADPHGAGFIVFRSGSDAPPSKTEFMAPGTVGWHELQAGDPGTDFAFYEKLFGWSKKDAFDMGDFTYQTAATGDGHATVGIMPKQPEVPYPFWSYYFSVADFDAALDRARDKGGQLLMEPMQVPEDMWICGAQDPQGALFNLIGPREKGK